METILRARIQNKYEIKENWDKLKYGDFIPLKGELCFTVIDNQLYIKIGDGSTDFVELPWLVNQSDWHETDENSPSYIKNKICDITSEDVNELFYNITTHNDDESVNWNNLIDDSDIQNYPEMSKYKNWLSTILYIEPAQVQGKMEETGVYTISFEGLEADYLGPQSFSFTVNKGIVANIYEGYAAGNSELIKNYIHMVGEEYFSLNSTLTNSEAPFAILVLDTQATAENSDLVRYQIQLAIDREYFSPQGLATFLNPSIYIKEKIKIEKIKDIYLPDFTSNYLEVDSSKASYIKHKHGVLYNGILEEPIELLPEITYTAGSSYSSFYRWDSDVNIDDDDFLNSFPEEILPYLNKIPVVVTVDGIEYETHLSFVNINDFDITNNTIMENDPGLGIYLGNFQELANWASNNLYQSIEGNTLNIDEPPFLIMPGTSLGKASLTVITSKHNHPLWFSSSEIDKKKVTVSIKITKLPFITSPLTTADICDLPAPVGEYDEYYNSVLFNSAYSARGINSIAAGTGTRIESEGRDSIVSGFYNTSSGKNSFVTGNINIIEGENSIAGGQMQIVGNNSAAFSISSNESNSQFTATKTDNAPYEYYHNYTILGDYVDYINQFNYILSPNFENPEYVIKLENSGGSMGGRYTHYDESTGLTTFYTYGYDDRPQNSQFQVYFVKFSNIADYSIVSGENNEALEDYSAVFGRSNIAKAQGSLVAGNYANTNTNTIFAIGNGNEFASSNAVEVDYEGNITGQDLVIKGKTINDNYFYRANLVQPNRNTTIKLNQKGSLEIRNKNLFKTDFVESEYITHNLDGSLTAIDGGSISSYSTNILLPPGTYILSNGMNGGNNNFYISITRNYSTVASTKSSNQEIFTLSKFSQVSCKVYYNPVYEEGVENITIFPQLELTSTGISSDFVKPKVEVVDSNENNECIINLIDWDNTTSVVATETNTVLNLEQSNLSIKQNLIPELEARINALEQQLQTLLNKQEGI